LFATVRFGRYTKICDSKTCRYEGFVNTMRMTFLTAFCTYHCPPSGQDSDPVCGSDAVCMTIECNYKKRPVLGNRRLNHRYEDVRGGQNFACDGEPPLWTPSPEKKYFLWRRTDSKTCPPNSYCHKGSNFANVVEVRWRQGCAETTLAVVRT